MDSEAMTIILNSRAGNRQWICLAVLALPVLLVSMDITVMYLVVPAISTHLHPTSSELLWITDIYGFFEAGLLITMGTLGDRIGRRKLLMIGGSAFALASLLAAFSHTVTQLIIARAVLGIAGASLLPSTLAMIRNLFHDPKQRTLALGIFTTCFSAGTMLGPFIGGILVNHFGWSSVFLMAIPVMALFLLLAPFLLPEFRDPVPAGFDLASATLSIFAALSCIYGIKQLAEHRFDITATGFMPLVFIVAGIALGFVFLLRQRKIEYPLIDIKLFETPAFSITQCSMFICIFAWAGIFLFISQQLQLVMGMDTFHAGLWTIFSAIGSIITCSITPGLVHTVPRRFVLSGGLFIMCVGLLIMYIYARQFPLYLLVISITLLSGGCGMAVTVGHDIVMNSAKPQQAGAAASITETFTTFGGAFGIALLGSVSTALYSASWIQSSVKNISAENVLAAKTTLGGAVDTASQLPDEQKLQLLQTAKAAFGYSFQVVAGISFVLLATMALLVIWKEYRTDE